MSIYGNFFSLYNLHIFCYDMIVLGPCLKIVAYAVMNYVIKRFLCIFFLGGGGTGKSFRSYFH